MKKHTHKAPKVAKIQVQDLAPRQTAQTKGGGSSVSSALDGVSKAASSAAQKVG